MTDIRVESNSEPQAIPVRRKRSAGKMTTAVSITLPTELHQTINGIVVRTNQSRSLVITELIEAGFTVTKKGE